MSPAQLSETAYKKKRAEMVRVQLVGRDITDRAVISAMRNIPRHKFVSPLNLDEAYEDHPLPIACNQTISQPYIVALMTQLLRVEKGCRVLEIGTGSGYQTAVLCALGAHVYSIERHEELTAFADDRLDELGYSDQVELFVDDGSIGCEEEAPFDRIIVTASAPEIPEALIDQLAVGGLMVIPVGKKVQKLLVLTRNENGVHKETVTDVLFVPLIGKQGWKDK